MSVTSDPPSRADQAEDQPAPGHHTPSGATPAGSPDAAEATAATTAGHWLHRLSADQWLSAAANELRSAQSALLAKQHRAGVTYARRAAGMALNARLWVAPDAAYGRSYMEHLQALRQDPAVSEELRDAARRLLAVPTTAQLVTLGPRGDTRPADFAARIVAYAQDLVSRRAAGSSDDSPAS